MTAANQVSGEKRQESLVHILKFSGAETQAELEVKGYQNITGTNTMAVQSGSLI